MRRILSVLVWCYLAALVAALVLLYTTGDRWWPSAFLLFGPRWLLALPLVALAPIALAIRRRLLLPLLVAGILLVGPILGFCVPWRRDSPAPATPSLRVLTCNVGVDPAAADSLGSLAARLRPDVIAIQELAGNARPAWLAGWHTIRAGELVVASRFPLREQRQDIGPHPPHRWPRTNMLHCVLETADGDMDFCNVHLPSPRHGISEVLDRSKVVDPSRKGTLLTETENRLETSRRVAGWVRQAGGPLVVAGDFNLPRESAIYRHDWSRYTDAFSQVGLGFGWTEWQTQHGVRFGIRIDHILMGPGWCAVRAWVGPDVGSDHLPVIAELARVR